MTLADDVEYYLKERDREIAAEEERLSKAERIYYGGNGSKRE